MNNLPNSKRKTPNPYLECHIRCVFITFFEIEEWVLFFFQFNCLQSGEETCTCNSVAPLVLALICNVRVVETWISIGSAAYVSRSDQAHTGRLHESKDNLLTQFTFLPQHLYYHKNGRCATHFAVHARGLSHCWRILGTKKQQSFQGRRGSLPWVIADLGIPVLVSRLSQFALSHVNIQYLPYVITRWGERCLPVPPNITQSFDYCPSRISQRIDSRRCGARQRPCVWRPTRPLPLLLCLDFRWMFWKVRTNGQRMPIHLRALLNVRVRRRLPFLVSMAI